MCIYFVGFVDLGSGAFFIPELNCFSLGIVQHLNLTCYTASFSSSVGRALARNADSHEFVSIRVILDNLHNIMLHELYAVLLSQSNFVTQQVS